MLFLRTLLRFDPWIPSGKVSVAPEVPSSLGRLRVDGIPLAGSRVSVEVDPDGTFEVQGLPPDVELVSEPRAPLTA